jgi:N-acyl-D-amino-acid deacylase
MDWDIVIRNCRVVDGTGRAAVPGEIGIRGGRIGEIGPACLGTAARAIDAAGMVACPGFIDMHTHSDLMLLAEPAATAKVMQGVTTEVIGQDGLSYAPVTDATLARFRADFKGINGDPPGLAWDWRTVTEFLDRFDRRASVNVAMLAPHGNLRAAVLGMENRRAAPAELDRMTRLLEQAMDEGAFGLSTGLTYAPCSYADTEELVALCRATARRGGFFAPHLRSYGADMEAAVEEAFAIAAAAQCPLHLTHFQASFSTGKGKAGFYLQKIEQARRQGLDVTLDAYPYLAGSTFLAGLLPSWVHEGGRERLRDRLSDPAARAKIRHEIEVLGADGMHKVPVDWSVIVVTDVGRAPRSDWIGLSLAKIAEQTGRPAFDCYADLILESDLAAACVTFIGHEENLQAFMRDPRFMGSSDGILVGARPHPRGWGTFARFLARYVRELGVLTLEECVRKLTALPATRLGLTDRGCLRPGCHADLVIFDPAAVQDTATYENPRSHPEGIPYVIVNGVLVKDNGRHTGATPGRALRHSSA